jgi:hypothetical protein
MFANTGTFSFLFYGIFIAVTIAALLVAFYLIKNGKIEPARLDKMIDLFKYAIVSTALATVTLVVSDLFKERAQDVKELEYFDKYVEDVKNVEGVQERLLLSKYLAIVAPSGELKKSWGNYYDSVKVEYREYLLLKKEAQRLDSLPNPTTMQLAQREQVQEKIKMNEAPLVSASRFSDGSRDVKTARSEEEKGFECLLRRDVINAITAFTNSENAYNSYHMVYEISKYLSDNKPKLTDPGSAYWKTALHTIATDFSYGMPADTRRKLFETAK